MTRLAFQAWDDFDVYTIASAITGYTLRGGGAPTFKPQYSTPAILPFKRRYAEFLTDATTDYHAFSRDLVDADANRATFDIVFGFAKDLCTVEELHVYARGAGTATMTDFVRASIVLATGAIRIDKMVASAYTAGSGASAGTTTLTAAHAYLCRFRGVAGAVSLKVWDAALGMAGEPAAFNLTPTGLTPTAAGWCAFGGKHTTLTAKVAAFNFDATATNGDTAICPLTNAEYTAWLGKQDVMRAVVAKMRCTGYDSSASPYTATRKVYLADHGYTSAQQDSPSLQHFDNAITGIPTFAREMPAALSGQATVNFGRLRVANPAVDVLVRQNLLVRSQELNTTWGPVAATIGVNATTAPDGTTTADKIQEDNTSNQHVVFQSITGTNGIEYVWSVYLKAAERTWGIISAFDGVADKRTWFNLSTGAVGTNAAGNSAAMEDAGGGWYRCTIKRVTADVDPTMTVGCATADNTVVYVGTTGSGIYAWGAQLRQANRSPLYVATVASAFNPPVTDQAPGLRDDWLRIHWLRDGFELLMGAPSWPLHDFRHIVRGRLGNPIAPDLKTIEFPIADMSEFFNRPLVTARIASGDWADQTKPVIFGQPYVVELAGDRVSLVYYGNDGPLPAPLNEQNPCIYDVTPTAFVHIGGVEGLVTTAVNAGTGEITVDAPHGMLNGYRLRWPSGTPPLGMAINTNYWLVGTTPGTDKFKLSATQGGAAITGGGTATPSSYYSYGYTFDLTLGTVTLVAPPAGRVLGLQLVSADAYTNSTYVSDVLNDVIFNQAGLSLNYKDASAFSAARAVDVTDVASTGYFIKTGANETALAVADKLAAGNCAWYGPTPEGLMQVGARALPSATPSAYLAAASIKAGSLRMIGSIRPIDFSLASVFFAPWFLAGGPITTPNINVGGTSLTSQTALQGRFAYPATSYGAAGIPLDSHPDQSDQREAFEFLSYDLAGTWALPARLVNFYQQTLGIFELETTLPAIERSIGETISLDFPRLGWKQFSASDPASPDNTATIDARLAVIIGINVNLAEKSPFKVKLKVFRRIPGFYPTANLN